jgi:hypothetical protein
MGLSADLMRQIGPAVVGAKLAARTERTDGCWFYRGPFDDRGRGLLWLADGRPVTAHRAAYYIAHGEIPDRMCVCHSCDTPRCVNPAHLWLGTQADNLADMRRKKREVVPPRDPVTGLFMKVY